MAPAKIGGERLNATFRPGPESNGILAARAFRSMDQPSISRAITASAIQTANHALKVFCCAEIADEASAVHPMATCPQPEMPVNAVARSIVSRMYLRLSIARSCSAGGSSFSGITRWIEPIGRMILAVASGVKYFAQQSHPALRN